jgi:hypothetical protein
MCACIHVRNICLELSHVQLQNVEFSGMRLVGHTHLILLKVVRKAARQIIRQFIIQCNKGTNIKQLIIIYSYKNPSEHGN